MVGATGWGQSYWFIWVELARWGRLLQFLLAPVARPAGEFVSDEDSGQRRLGSVVWCRFLGFRVDMGSWLVRYRAYPLLASNFSCSFG